MPNEKKSVLIILDGWGYRQETADNAIAQANTPFYDKACNTYPKTLLQASESYVGLPSGVMGNSEVGHTNIGCGRKVTQDQVRIYEAIENGSFFTNKVLLDGLSRAQQRSAKVHLMGLISTGNVHSAQEHYFAMLEAIQKFGFDMNHCFVHPFLDGRDVAPQSASTFIENLEKQLKKTGGAIATVSGRYYAMDRDKRWERTGQAYDAIVCGKGKHARSALQALQDSYEESVTDEFLVPTVIMREGSPVATVDENDLIVCFNFRADRMRQIVRGFKGYEHGMGHAQQRCPDVITMTEYDETFDCPVLFGTPDLSMSLGEYLSVNDMSQFRCAETEKYAHVTFFLNGGREQPFANEHRCLIPSPKVSTYDQTPAMHSKEVCEKMVQRILKEQDDFMVVNFAQPDMVGHTGNWDAAIEAVEATDRVIEEISQTALDKNYTVFLTADHGNIEMMKDPVTGQPHTSHTLAPVPLLMIGKDVQGQILKEGGSLSNIAPTVLSSMELKVPAQMTAKSLLQTV